MCISYRYNFSAGSNGLTLSAYNIQTYTYSRVLILFICLVLQSGLIMINTIL